MFTGDPRSLSCPAAPTRRAIAESLLRFPAGHDSAVRAAAARCGDCVVSLDTDGDEHAVTQTLRAGELVVSVTRRSGPAQAIQRGEPDPYGHRPNRPRG